MQTKCDYEGCEKGIATGHALYRISPTGPGQKFIGMCEDHYVDTPEFVAKVIEQHNQRSK